MVVVVGVVVAAVAGLFLGGSIPHSSCAVYSGEVPLMAAAGVDALLGLDLLGASFALDLQRNKLELW